MGSYQNNTSDDSHGIDLKIYMAPTFQLWNLEVQEQKLVFKWVAIICQSIQSK
jgi:hypothetical protein